MTGYIGVWLLGDKQVGGFKGWTTIITKQPIHSKVIASGFWMLEAPADNKFLARFYNDDMDLVLEKEAIVHLPETYLLDTFIVRRVEIDFADDFDWREL